MFLFSWALELYTWVSNGINAASRGVWGRTSVAQTSSELCTNNVINVMARFSHWIFPSIFPSEECLPKQIRHHSQEEVTTPQFPQTKLARNFFLCSNFPWNISKCWAINFFSSSVLCWTKNARTWRQISRRRIAYRKRLRQEGHKRVDVRREGSTWSFDRCLVMWWALTFFA